MGIAYAIIARQAGFDIAETVGMSVLVFAGASQIMAAGMYEQGAALIAIILAAFVLNLIPYTAMAALTFPGILTVDSSTPWVGVAGGCVAAGLAWKKMPVMVCVLAAIAAEYLIYTFILMHTG